MSNLGAILPPFWRDTIRQYLHDDCPGFDVQGFVVGGKYECVAAHSQFSHDMRPAMSGDFDV